MDKNYYRILYRVIGRSAPPLFEYNSDEQLYAKVRAQIIHRDQDYSDLLHSYVNTSRVRNVLKEIHKWVLFWGMVYACVMGYHLIDRIISPILDSKDVAVIVDAMPVLIASLVAFISAVIAIPLAVVNFLFNTKEDDNITEIIKHTQEHDAKGRAWVKPTKPNDELGDSQPDESPADK